MELKGEELKKYIIDNGVVYDDLKVKFLNKDSIGCYSLEDLNKPLYTYEYKCDYTGYVWFTPFRIGRYIRYNIKNNVFQRYHISAKGTPRWIDIKLDNDGHLILRNKHLRFFTEEEDAKKYEKVFIDEHIPEIVDKVRKMIISCEKDIKSKEKSIIALNEKKKEYEEILNTYIEKLLKL